MAIQGTSYADWLNQNEAAMMQAGGAPPPIVAQQPPPAAPVQAQVQAQPAPAVAAPATAVAPVDESQGQSQWQKLSGMLASQGGGQSAPTAIRPSAFSQQVQPDAPQATRAQPMRGRAGKIAEIIGAIMSFGATKAVSQAQKNAQPDPVQQG